jgi:hypothetical protein
LPLVLGSWGLLVYFRDFFWNACIYFIILVVACIAGRINWNSGIHFVDGLFRIQNIQKFISEVLDLAIIYPHPVDLEVRARQQLLEGQF